MPRKAIGSAIATNANQAIGRIADGDRGRRIRLANRRRGDWLPGAVLPTVVGEAVQCAASRLSVADAGRTLEFVLYEPVSFLAVTETCSDERIRDRAAPASPGVGCEVKCEKTEHHEAEDDEDWLLQQIERAVIHDLCILPAGCGEAAQPLTESAQAPIAAIVPPGPAAQEGENPARTVSCLRLSLCRSHITAPRLG